MLLFLDHNCHLFYIIIFGYLIIKNRYFLSKIKGCHNTILVLGDLS